MARRGGGANRSGGGAWHQRTCAKTMAHGAGKSAGKTSKSQRAAASNGGDVVKLGHGGIGMAWRPTASGGSGVMAQSAQYRNLSISESAKAKMAA